MIGYNPEFLGTDFRIDIPWINYDKFKDVLKTEDLRQNYIADYTHYSLIMSKKHRQAYLSICNLDQTQYRSVEGRKWFLDDRIGFENQLDNSYYKGSDNLWDRGHLTRRTAVTWGKSDFIAKKASNDSCCYANACLQHRFFNEDEWRIPEKVAAKLDRDKDGKISIMTGPLFTPNDRYFEPKDYNVLPARVPSGFWKVLYYIDKKKSQDQDKDTLGCEAYLVYQDDLSVRDKNGADNLAIQTLQISISELSDLTGFEFPEPLFDANPLWYFTEGRDIHEPERYEIKAENRSERVKKDWPGHVIHDRKDIAKHKFRRVSR